MPESERIWLRATMQPAPGIPQTVEFRSYYWWFGDPPCSYEWRNAIWDVPDDQLIKDPFSGDVLGARVLTTAGGVAVVTMSATESNSMAIQAVVGSDQSNWHKILFCKRVLQDVFAVYYCENGYDKPIVKRDDSRLPTYTDGNETDELAYAKDIAQTMVDANTKYRQMAWNQSHPLDSVWPDHELKPDLEIGGTKYLLVYTEFYRAGFTNGYQGETVYKDNKSKTRYVCSLMIGPDLWRWDADSFQTMCRPNAGSPTRRAESSMAALACAHELFHAYQNRYEGGGQESWLKEGSATWAPDYPFPEADWYYSEVKAVFESPREKPFWDVPGRDAYYYGMAIFCKYLCEVWATTGGQENPGIMRDVWASGWNANLPDDSLQAVAQVVGVDNMKRIQAKFWQSCKTKRFLQDNNWLPPLKEEGP